MKLTDAYGVGWGCQEQLQSRRLTLDLTNPCWQVEVQKESSVGAGMGENAPIAVPGPECRVVCHH